MHLFFYCNVEVSHSKSVLEKLSIPIPTPACLAPVTMQRWIITIPC